MSMSINTNVSSMTAQRSAGKVQDQLTTSMSRLSSGLRINSAKDDAAGLAITERFTTQIRGLNQAARNANDAISLSQTAEGALASVGDNLQRIRELAVQSANATNSSSDRAALQAEAAQLISEVQRVGSQTEFNGVKLLDGSFNAKDFQVGANAGQTIRIDEVADARAGSLGTQVLTTSGTHGLGGIAVGSSTAGNGIPALSTAAGFTLTTAQGGTSGPISYGVSASAADIAHAINLVAGGTGAVARATNSARLSAPANLVAGPNTLSFTLNGTQVSGVVSDPTDLSGLATAINAASATTGVTASFTNGNKSSVTLNTADGRNIDFVDFAGSGAGSQSIAFSNSFGTAVLNEGGTDSAVGFGTFKVTSTRGGIVTSNAPASLFTNASTASGLSTLASVNISTAQGAVDALDTIDGALAQVNGNRANLGAIQNRFSTTISNLQTNSENLAASRSRIQDADFASETANLSRSQVLQQAATAMIAQANQMPQQVLSLLR